MSRILALFVVLPVLTTVACSDSPPSQTSDGGADVVSGFGGSSGTGAGTGGSNTVPGGGGGTTGSTPGVPGAGGAGSPGTPPIGVPNLDALPGLDAGLPGLIDAGVVATCPAMPANKACGGQGMPALCVVPNAMPPMGCVCLLQRWFCGGDMNAPTPGADAGLPIGTSPTACPANAMGSTCPSVGAICTAGTGMSGCICLPNGANGNAWVCR